jgi:2-polyprenyl-6-hydroxyphenyl methylase/3-demethylubiquinone-9 3-methyltransferase
MVTIAENVIGLVPRGAHDVGRFIRPKDLARKLDAVGLKLTGLAGFGPRWINRRLDFVFGFLPTLAIQYLGAARVMGRDSSDHDRFVLRGPPEAGRIFRGSEETSID